MTELVSRSSALLLALRGAVLNLALGPRAPSGEVVWPEGGGVGEGGEQG